MPIYLHVVVIATWYTLYFSNTTQSSSYIGHFINHTSFYSD